MALVTFPAGRELWPTIVLNSSSAGFVKSLALAVIADPVDTQQELVDSSLKAHDEASLDKAWSEPLYSEIPEFGFGARAFQAQPHAAMRVAAGTRLSTLGLARHRFQLPQILARPPSTSFRRSVSVRLSRNWECGLYILGYDG